MDYRGQLVSSPRFAAPSLTFLNNRHYDPSVGVFISVDPLVANTMQPYIYGAANPVTYSDPSGLDPDNRVWMGSNTGVNKRKPSPTAPSRDRADERDRGGTASPGRGRGSGGDLNSDREGRDILDCFLRGDGQPFSVVDDPRWNLYMVSAFGQMSSAQFDVFRSALLGLNAQAAAWGGPDQDGRVAVARADGLFFNLPNGEGILGYNYLHGPDRDLGGIEMYSYVSESRSADGGTSFTIQNGVTWNDTIDPNEIYTSDRVKNFFAEVASLGEAEPYQLSILFTFETQFIVSPGGRSGISEWPFGP